jgi:cephalosporin-C deacetylase
MKLALVILTSVLIGSASAQNIDEFWRATRERLAREPLEAKVDPVREPVAFSVYTVTLRSLGGAHFVARMSIPVQGESPAQPWPVIITVPGYGGEQQGATLSECQRGYVILQVFPRGQGDSAPLGRLKGDKLTGTLDGPEGAYYQGAYADVIRAIDFAVARKDVDPHRVALMGTSQGGGIALAVASLDDRVRAVVAHVPFLCDIRLAARTPSLVKTLLDRAKRNDDDALNTLDYFDPLQLVTHLHAPALVSAGGEDHTCPLPTIRAVYDRIGSTAKTLKVYPKLRHTSCVDFYNLSWAWLDEHFRNRKGETFKRCGAEK